MTDRQFQAWLIILVGAPTILAALVSIASLIMSCRNHGKLEAVRIEINGHMDSLLKMTREAGRQEERDKQAAEGNPPTS